MPKISILPLFLAFVFAISINVKAQSKDPQRFKTEVESLVLTNSTYSDSDMVLLFVGSSSFRKWNSLPSYFPSFITVNNGFGGSHMNDLLYYKDELIFPYHPCVIFIYEGDNDIAAGLENKQIIKSTKKLLKAINKKYKAVPVVLLAAKPSPSRWKFKDEYLVVNSQFEKMAAKKEMLFYADVWNVMLDSEGNPDASLFISDDLHMTEKGYQAWGEVLNPILKEALKE